MAHGDFIVTRPGPFDPSDEPSSDADAADEPPLAEERILREPVHDAPPAAGPDPDASSLADERVLREPEAPWGARSVELEPEPTPLAEERVLREPAVEAPHHVDPPAPSLAQERIGERIAEPTGDEPAAAPPIEPRPNPQVRAESRLGIGRDRFAGLRRVIRPEIHPGRAKRWRRLMVNVMGLAVAVAVALTVLGIGFYRFVDPPYTPTMAIRAVDGADIRRDVVPIEQISPHLVRAVIAAEDSRFCQHRGFDRAEILRAMAAARRGEGLRGASTISQQTAKNAFLWTGGGFVRKGAEAVLTGLVEFAWPKRRIMEVYLNEAEWGDGLFGAEAAAQGRFGKSAADLSRREAALLAAVLPSPNRYRLDPPGEYVASRAATIEQRMDIVRRDGLAACVLDGLSQPATAQESARPSTESPAAAPPAPPPAAVDPRPPRDDPRPLPEALPPLEPLPVEPLARE